MSNSSLVNYTKISPNRTSPRTHAIDTITIHCVVGQLSVETMGNMFAQSSYQASCNYAIGTDGRIALIVDEKDRSWCSSNKANDHRAITIECASDLTHPYAVNAKVYESLINLLADICKRNNIKELKWKGDKSLIGKIDKQNMTVHRWFANKACPGDYLYNRHGQIAAEVNKKLSDNAPIIEEPVYRVRRTWNDEKSQLFAGSLEGCKKNCAIGYSVFDETGKVVYTNKVSEDNVDKIWMGWTKRETGSAGLRCIHGDAGKAYGLQFDYRYGLIDFLQYCVDYNSDRYNAFKKFISMGKGNNALIYNQELGKLWQEFYDKYTVEFESLQYTCAYKNYYLPVKEYLRKFYGIELDSRSPAVKGTAWSMSFRSGQESGAKRFAGCNNSTPDNVMLDKAYSSYGTADGGRWTKAGQWGDAINALNNGEYADILKSMTTAVVNDNSDTNTPATPSTPVTPALETDNFYRVGTAWKDGKCVGQVGAYTILDNAAKEANDQRDLCKKTYYVFDGSGKIVHTAKYEASVLYTVQAGSFNVKSNADKLVKQIKAKGIDAMVVKSGNQYVVQCGVFSVKSNADRVATSLKKNGFSSIIKTSEDTSVSQIQTQPSSAPGSKVVAKAKELANIMISEKWAYSNSGNKMNFDSARKASKKVSNCALFASHVLQETGQLNKNQTFYFKTDGKVVSRKGGWERLKQTCKVTMYNGVVLNKIHYSMGDIVCYNGHVNIFAGYNSKGVATWIDAGRGGTQSCKAGSPFTNNMFQTSNTSSYKVYAVVSPK